MLIGVPVGVDKPLESPRVYPRHLNLVVQLVPVRSPSLLRYLAPVVGIIAFNFLLEVPLLVPHAQRKRVPVAV